MDKIQKALRKLSDTQRAFVKEILDKLHANKTQGLDIAKLKDHYNIYRVRKGRVRIIFRIENTTIYLLKIDRRSDTTYNKF
ncbi:hypothetical protein HY621_00465 [Candidatus Uhrbacteria bacterium]|nr:hypothetical protein [Candidatus Uhrbacteria bacterium]